MSEIPPPLPPITGQATQPVSSGSLGLAIFCIVVGLFFLVPGGVCTVIAITAQFGGREEASYGVLFAIFSVPAVLIGLAFGYAAYRLRKRPAQPPVA